MSNTVLRQLIRFPPFPSSFSFTVVDGVSLRVLITGRLHDVNIHGLDISIGSRFIHIERTANDERVMYEMWPGPVIDIVKRKFVVNATLVKGEE